ncbi:hypothetical protein ACPUVO_08560 [Pseudocolwellia sp. HL-MZ19]|uniref:hypothetical protein n=1 Tax=Pseudocolwellia sp. HL-MZ19 TaxID=3400846 RepID=UPI003CE9E487
MPFKKYTRKINTPYYKDGLHDSSNKKSDNEHWGDGSWKNSISSSFATSYDQNNNLNNTGGLYSFYDLKEDTKKDTGPSIVAMLTKPTNKLRVQETLDDESNTYNRSDTIAIEEQGSVAGNSLYGLSKAETYFSRPKDLWARADNMREYGNLYNPFWQTRLIDNNATEQATAAVLQAVN